jgi:hypothetical protein
MTRLTYTAFDFQAKKGGFLFSKEFHTGSVAHPAYCSKGTGNLFLGVKQQRRKANHLSACNTNVKNMWS